ncbi:MAG TPA: sigma-54 dependent transcriptional regulator [Candidatus Dormibacteraeota bacterium]|nr:sigma-54 dependent transcriptional regulator [Candidatus Dormibacteraeota bacterium]
MGRILLVDDEPNMRRILASNLRQDQHQILEAGGVEEAQRSLAAHDFDVVITDQKMPDGEGLAVLASARENDPTLPVILLTAVATIELAVESMRSGAFDFLTKPFQPEVVRATVRRACERTRLLRENILLKDAVVRLEGTSEIYGDSPAMHAVRERIARVAPTHATVLITGETGTGKEVVARAIHRNSPRESKPFVAVNCAAFTETLLESELFGHEKGAFTGADRQRQGLFEAAHEGTLFLDEAGEMSLAAQAKLLRVLTDGQVVRVGSTRPRRVDVRVLVATHRNLEQRVKEGSFREDLFYRLAVVPIHLPPLRERGGDIAGLSDVFCHQVATELKMPRRRLTAEALAKLQHYAFPGNLRELKNLIERAYILTSNHEIGADDLPVQQKEGVTNGNGSGHAAGLSIPFADSFDLTGVLEKTEKELILRTLNSTHGAQAEAARRMGLSRSALAYKLTKYGIRTAE